MIREFHTGMKKDYPSLREARAENRSHNIFVKLNNETVLAPIVEKAKGGIRVYKVYYGTLKMYEWLLNTKFDRIYAIRTRTLQEVSKIKPIGKYKDSLGGGWSSSVDKYIYNDEEYANMECTCQ